MRGRTCGFLKNLAGQLRADTPVVVAMPAWLRENMQTEENNKNLKFIDVGNYNIVFSIEKNMLKLDIKMRGDV